MINLSENSIMEDQGKKEDQFEWWITTMPDKIVEMKENLPRHLHDQLDYTIRSIDVLENHLITDYSSETLSHNKIFWDGFASYLAKVYKAAIPASEWHIELEDKLNVFYNMPALRTNELMFVPHAYISAALNRKKGNFISTIIQKHVAHLQQS